MILQSCSMTKTPPKTMLRFGKSADSLLHHKRSFFEENESLLEEGHRIARIYVEQPRRSECKCCRAAIGPAAFTKHSIDYHICDNCGHLNGSHEDTDEFCATLYTGDKGRKYAKNYASSDKEAYHRRVKDIYEPKAEFLKDALNELGVEPQKLSYTDLGAGSGYFVAAMRNLGWQNSVGYEVSKAQVELAQAMIERNAVRQHDLQEIETLAGEIECDVVSMIGVLEHLQKPRDVLRALRENRHVNYLYISVPLFSPCVIFEMIFPTVFQRQLSAGHTHLYTETSLQWVCKEFQMKSVAEWWFGTDMVDLFRSVSVQLERQEATDQLKHYWADMFGGVIDDLQYALDRKKLSSEVHLLLEFTA
jgi:hypothetical protein